MKDVKNYTISISIIPMASPTRHTHPTPASLVTLSGSLLTNTDIFFSFLRILPFLPILTN